MPIESGSFELALADIGGVDQQKERMKQEVASPRPPETYQDLRKKEVFQVDLPKFKGAIDKQSKELKGLVEALKKAEGDFSTFSSPENLLGLSTIIRGDGKTMTADIHESVEVFQSQTTIRMDSVNKLLCIQGTKWFYSGNFEKNRKSV